MSADLIYLYGFVPPDGPAPPADLEGIEGRAVELHALGAFAAVVTRVPASDYGDGVIESRLKDLDWVAARGASHEQVVTWFVDQCGIVPSRFLTLYRSLESLEQTAGERGARIRAVLDRFRGRHEWDLKVSYDPEILAGKLGELSPEIGALDEEMRAAAPGRRYLLGRAKGDRVKEESRQAARELAEDLLQPLSTLAEAVVRVPMSREAEGGRVVLNAALLVPEDRRSDILSAVESRSRRLQGAGLRIEFTGPWAPYRFLDAPGVEGRADP